MLFRSALPSRAVPAVILALALWASTAQAQALKLGGTGAALGTMKILAEAYARQQPGFSLDVLPSMGSGGGIKAVLAGAVQIAVSARPLQDKEIQAGAVAVEFGRTPFVFATQAATKARGINTQNLSDIYAGRLERWPDGQAIRLVLRPIGDSDSETIKAMSPALGQAKAAAEQRKGMLFAVTDQEAADALEKTPGSFGPTTLALLLSEKRALKALVLDGVAPDARSIADGRYPHFKTMLLVTGPKSPPEVQGFVNFVRSAGGREILARCGYWLR